MDEIQKQMKFNLLPEVKPLYASEVLTNTQIKETKDKKDREAIITLDFVDRRFNLIVSSVNITMILAKGLRDALDKAIQQAEKFLKTGEKPKGIIETSGTSEDRGYIG